MGAADGCSGLKPLSSRTPEGVSGQLDQKLSTRGRQGEGRPESGVSAAAREIGVDRNEIRRAAKIDAITPEAKQAARDVGIDVNQSALLKVASVPAGEQVAEVTRIKTKKAERVAVPPELDSDHVADFVDFIVAHMPEAAIPTLATYLEKGMAKKFAAALRSLIGSA